MSNSAAVQIEQIHRMLESGQRSVRLEKHTLILWGLIAASLIVLINSIITPERMPTHWHRVLLSNTIIAVVVTIAAYWDFQQTRLKREARDESISYLQLQLTKVWWFLIGLIVLINIGVNIFGGAYLFYPILISLTGLGFYIHGLFSQQLLAWNGILVILSGLTAIILQVPFETLEWFTVVLFGIGLPAMAWLIDLPVVQQNLKHRLFASLAWLCLITAPTWFIHQVKNRVAIPDWPVISMQDYQEKTDTKLTGYVVQLPVATNIPLTVTFSGDAINTNKPTSVPLQLTKPLAIAINKGVADGRYRIGEGQWLKPRRKFYAKKTRLDAYISQATGVQIELDLLLKITE